MKKQLYLCVDLVTRTQEKLRTNRPVHGHLTMEERDERFSFTEEEVPTWKRNPRVYEGQMLNVSLTKDGRLEVHLRHMELSPMLDPKKACRQIKKELSEAMKLLLPEGEEGGAKD